MFISADVSKLLSLIYGYALKSKLRNYILKKKNLILGLERYVNRESRNMVVFSENFWDHENAKVDRLT